jgi:cell fate (sporulation/competence/biofilm development) regulator YmcA (YheA/YmcA/DUF963 family)
MLNNLDAWGQVLTSAIEILAVIWAGFKLVSKVINRLDKLDEIDDRIKKVESQYVPNGGSSMRDAVNRIEKQVEHLQERLEHHIDNNR